MDSLKPSLFGETLRHFDDLMAEARDLRTRIVAALHRETHPFFPDRRNHYERHQPDRRRPAQPEL